MTRIILDKDTYLDRALQFARDDDFEQALFLLRNQQDYQSCLVKVVLLFKMFEFASARQLMWWTICNFSQQYTVVDDLKYCCNDDIVEFSDQDIFGDNIPQNRQSANRDKLLLLIECFEDLFLMSQEVQNELGFGLQDDDKPIFYDVNSPDYYEDLLEQAEMYHVRKQYDKEYKVAQIMARYEGDNVDILQMQLGTFLRDERWAKRAFDIALAIHDNKQLSEEGKLAVADVFADYRDYRPRAKELLLELYDSRDVMRWSAVFECMHIANNKLKDEQTALLFADYLSSNIQSSTFPLLKKCIYVYFNFGQSAKAGSTAKTILSLYGQDKFAQTVLDYCTTHKRIQKPSLVQSIPETVNNNLPQKVAKYLLKQLRGYQKQIQDKAIKCTEQMLVDIYQYLSHLKAMYYLDNKNYVEGIRLVIELLQCVTLRSADIQLFWQSALEYITSSDADNLVCSILLRWLYNLDSNQKLILRTMTTPYLLDMAMFDRCQEDNDKLITLCYLAVVLPIDNKLCNQILEQFDLLVSSENFVKKAMSVSQMSYCILRRILPNDDLKKLRRAFDDVDYEQCDKLAFFDKITN